MRAVGRSRALDPRFVALRGLVILIGGLAALVAFALADAAHGGGGLHSAPVQQAD
jgi:hypothetical protein